MVAALSQAALIQDRTADLLNVAIEEIVKERYELPAFSTLDRLTSRVRSVVNKRLFQKVVSQMSSEEMSYLDELLLSPPSEKSLASLSDLKAIPQNATLSHLQSLQAKFERLMSFGIAKRLLQDIAPAKIKHFATLAKAMDTSELAAVKLSKRRTLLLCLLHQAQVKTKDYLVEMFLKRLAKIHQRAKERLIELREKHRAITEHLLKLLREVLEVADEEESNEAKMGCQIQLIMKAYGGVEFLRSECEAVAAYNSDNYLPLLWHFYRSHRPTLYRLVSSLEIRSTTQDESLVKAIGFLLANEHLRGQWLPEEIELDFVSQQWKRLLLFRKADGTEVLVRRQLEMCVFSYLALELKTGDACVLGSENFADYREQLLSWEECHPLLEDYCHELGFAKDAEGFVKQLKVELTKVAEETNQICSKGDQITISASGEPVLKRLSAQPKPGGAAELEAAIRQRMPERSLLDILCNVEHWLNWTRHFAPLSGLEAKLERARERYILTTFGYGCNLGPSQTARHARGQVSRYSLSYINRRHITTQMLEAAICDTINSYNRFNLPKFWGTGKRASADGTKFDIYQNNLVAEYHIRYGGYGGIAYNHVADTYIALFTHFISCGVWEAVYILDGLLKNRSDIQPDILHADTQGQSAPVFALAYLLGIKLMPRIRNWKDYTFFLPHKNTTYSHINPLFHEVVDWKLIQTHWQDLIRVVLSIRVGKLMPSTLLRKLGTYSHKNRLYQAFRELGRVVRTIFLLQYISDRGLRQIITASTNQVEAYNGFLDWLFFGKDGVITENDPDEQEKRIKYLHLVANAVILQNAVDMSSVIQVLVAEGYSVSREMISTLSPYVTQHIKRYGDYVVDLSQLPQPLESAIELPVEL